jgi:NAD(P)-dependent dehydrogenase (short-subunit alcohol dehydrogenase family)
MSDPIDPTRRLFLTGAAALGATLAGGAVVAAEPQAARAVKAGRFEGKVALITGGTSGIGKATAEAFAREGASVAFCGRREALGNEVAKAIGDRALFVRADVTDESQVKAFVDAAVARFGKVDHVFANAGIDRPNANIDVTDAALFDEVINVNLRGVFLTLKHAIAQMRRQPPGGSIVLVASVGGHRGYPGIIAYSASKAAVLSMTRTAANEVGAHGIRVNSISPGPIDTAMLDRAVKDWGLPNKDAFAAGSVFKRIATPDEVASAVLFLSGDESLYSTGGDFLVDGGYLLK